ncbi:xanthine dehydrogenase family protein molybdopterin-binding subunit [Spongiibacter sp. KMU-158]|uniref:Xanthine dehydrogenase family protein molybdopterin-binding subunit n=1 Tax=Spongiibacter pelagi TaxID=2760804 RepID=A0A927C0W9_9GAMM|nr:molybdopterin cofactor-binding domain-containing protein [Spongiibacter pelagi]MBD2857992.1 xanthine dehydrogenase family protein molybdopterin-binding subunit [Spongiibacter pelagi]
MSAESSLSRRHFLRLSIIAGGGLLVACGGSSSKPSNNLSPSEPEDNGPIVEQQFGDFLKIGSDNSLTVFVGATEIGQGILTGIAMAVAEELDADWSKVKAVHSPVAIEFNNPYFGSAMQSTVASASMRGYYKPQRQIGARIRQLMINTAAARWQVDAARLQTEAGYVIDPVTNRSISYGELSADAQESDIPATAELKSPEQYKIIGTSQQRLDAASKVDGSLIYGIDVDIPDMLTAVIARPPRFSGQPLIVDSNAALAVPGVLEVHQLAIGVAVVAEDFWSAEKGRKALEVTWNELLASRTDSELQRSQYELQLNLPGVPIRVDGAVVPAQLLAAETVQADYYFPFQAHAAMEPLNVVIDYDGSRAEIWTGTQSPTLDKLFASLILGLPPTQINFHIMPCGGGFGRRGNWLGDFVRDACQVAAAVRKPVKVMWSREDDMKGGFYRPAAAVRMSASLNTQGEISAWTHRSVTQDMTAFLYGEKLFDEVVELNGGTLPALDKVTDFDSNFVYDVSNVLMDFHLVANLQMPALWMRSVNKYTDIFAQETFLDVIASRSGEDPYQFRRNRLSEAPRHLAVLNAAATAANWGQARSGATMGIALMGHWNSFIAQVVEMSISADKEITIHKITSAIDCGTAVNPDLVIAQVESAIVFALSSIFYGEITLDDGVVQQSNYDDYRVLRMFESPEMETILINSTEDPGGVGEIGVPCVGPALANAIYAATGATIRELPLRNLGYSMAEQHPEAGGQS